MYAIGRLSSLANVKIPTIRYYEEISILPKAERSSGGQRRYGQSDLERLNFIRHARDLGLGIEDIRDLLRLSENGENPCVDADRIATQHLSKIKDKIKHLRRLEKELKRIVSHCQSKTIGDCYVIQSLANHALCGDEHKEGL